MKFTPATRQAIYRVVAAVMALLIARGLVTQEQADLWLQVITQGLALASVLLASANVQGDN